MEHRVTRLEVEFEHVRRDLDEIKADQKTIISKLNDIAVELRAKPSTGAFWGMIGTVAVIALTVVGLIIAGMGYLKG